MLKYKIEGGIDFFSELYKSLDDEDTDKNDYDNLCLITNLPLGDNCFKMECGHSFNYVPLYLDIKNHKQKFNGMEGNASRLNKNEIRCPYCRKKQLGVLPYYEELGLPKIDGVNYIDANYKVNNNLSQCYKHCQFLTPNPNFDPNGENVSETSEHNNSNCKYYLCFHMGSKINFFNGFEAGENYGDDKYYCWTHKKQMIKKYKTEIAIKVKEEVKLAKILAKQEIKKQKEEEKQKAKEEKHKTKEEKQKAKEESNANKKQKSQIENLVLGPTVITDMSGNKIISGCVEILKSGPNKGKQCGCKIVSENMCKRHTTLKSNKNEIISKITI
jgi:hypothetical protein